MKVKPTGLALSRENGHIALIVNEGHEGDNAKIIIIHSTSMNKVEYQADYVFPGRTEDLCYLNDSGLVACGGGRLKVFSPSLELVQTLGHGNRARCVTVSPSGSHIASGGRNGKVMIWSESGEGGEWARVQVLEDHTDYIWAVCFSPDGKQLATGSSDRLIKTYSFNE